MKVAQYNFSVLTMWLKILVTGFLIVLSFSSFLSEKSNATTATLKALHILFRHGHRTTDDIPSHVYPNDPYKHEKYYPYGFGQLTNKGKRRAYALGQWLRERYNSFLGNVYHPLFLEAVSSGYNRTAATLALVLAGLYPPKGTDLDWNENLNWQPALFHQLPSGNYLSFPLTSCPRYEQLLGEYMNGPLMKNKTEFYKPLMDYIKKHSGASSTSLPTALFIYDVLETQREWGLELPAWTAPIYPNILYGATLDFFDILAATPELKRYAAGALLNKIVTETALIIANKTVPPEKNLFIYSAHDMNVILLLKLLGVYVSHRPTYAACLILEVHQINQIYGIKIYYGTRVDGDPKLLKMPGCDYFCPFKKFYKLVKDYLPTKNMTCKADSDNYNREIGSFFH